MRSLSLDARGAISDFLIVALVISVCLFLVSCTSTQRRALVPETLYAERSEGDAVGSTGTDLFQRTGTLRSEGWTVGASWNAHALLGFEPEPLLVKWAPRPVRMSDDYEEIREAPTMPAPDPAPIEDEEGAGAIEGLEPWMETQEATEPAPEPADEEISDSSTWGPVEWGAAIGALLVPLGVLAEALRRKRKAA